MVYTAESQSLALLELMVQDDPLRAHYVLIPAQLPADLPETRIDVDQLPMTRARPAPEMSCRPVGQAWLEGGLTAVLNVPCAVVPAERNYLLNPRHPGFSRILIGETQSLQTDTRLLRNLGKPI